jgi:hypothetical protein
MISTQFPTVGKTHPQPTHNSHSCQDGIPQQHPVTHPTTRTQCYCPTPQLPPPRPTKLPCPANETNIPQLQQRLHN